MTYDHRYKRGSEWKKWDLQIQPIKNEWFIDLPKNHDKIKDATKEYLKEAVHKNISVVAITDHNCGIAIDKALEIVDEDKLDITVLPGVEIRVNVGFHLIVIINQSYKDTTKKETWEKTIEDFLHNVCGIKSPVFDDNGQSEAIDGKINEILERICKDDIGIPLFAHCQSKEGFFKNGKAKDRKGYFELYLASNYFFAFDHKSDEEIKKTQEKIETWKYDSNKYAYIKTSDAHKASEVGKVFSWIKADPTYYGLKQIIYEPIERVNNLNDNPSLEYNKPYFDKIEIKDKIAIINEDKDQVYFCKKTLLLNKNLVAIIGSRGTGKSMLVDYLASIFDKDIPNKPTQYFPDSNFSVSYSKDNIVNQSTEEYHGGKKNHLDFIYIPQAHLKKIASKKQIEQEVKKLLDLEDLSFSQELNDEIQDLLKEIQTLKEWFEKVNEDGNKINQKEYVKSSRDKNEGLLKSITTKNNKEKLEKYTANISNLEDLNNTINKIDELYNMIEHDQEKLNQHISEFDETLSKKDGYKPLIKIDFKAQLENIVENKKIAENIKGKKQSENEIIKKDFERDGYTGDLLSLLKNAGTYQTDIKKADDKLVEISKKDKELSEKWKKRDNLSKKIETEYKEQKEKINKAWEGMLEKHEGQQKDLIERILLKDGEISVEGEIFFDESTFYKKMHKSSDKRSYKEIKDLEIRFKIFSFEDWIKFINNDLKNFIDGEESDKIKDIEKIFFEIKERGEYLKILPKITYNGRKLTSISIGQRGTVFLCIKLATDAFSKPIIFDQPEDDLDNKFITTKLVDIFKKLKRYRQIIIVTHNPNLVVNADAEQVIIANNNNEELNYESGSLENDNIIKSVCEIMEGGKEAFEKRKQKYYFPYKKVV